MLLCALQAGATGELQRAGAVRGGDSCAGAARLGAPDAVGRRPALKGHPVRQVGVHPRLCKRMRLAKSSQTAQCASLWVPLPARQGSTFLLFRLFPDQGAHCSQVSGTGGPRPGKTTAEFWTRGGQGGWP